MSLSPNKKQRIGDIKIGYLGSNCSFTCRATKRFFNEYEINNIVNIEYESVHSCQAIFHKVATGQIVYGVVPVESSSHGTIPGSYDQLLKFSEQVKIIAETVEMETYCLSMNPASLPLTSDENITRVISHSTILDDSSDYFDALDTKRVSQGLPVIERIPAVDSAAACKMLLSMPDSTGTAVICCQEAAELYNLSIVSPSIGNDRNSETRYLVVAQNVNEQFVDPLTLAFEPQSISTQRENVKSTLALSLKNVSGAMFRMISCFALRDLNVYKVETRPSSTAIGLQGLPTVPGSRFKHWDLIFFIDYQPSDQNAINEALNHNLNEYSVWVRSLGIYRQYGQRQTITEPSNWSNMVDILATA